MSLFQFLFHKIFNSKGKRSTTLGEHEFGSLPSDVAIYILTYLTYPDIIQVCLVSRHYYEICSSSILWEQINSQLWINNVLNNPQRIEFYNQQQEQKSQTTSSSAVNIPSSRSNDSNPSATSSPSRLRSATSFLGKISRASSSSFSPPSSPTTVPKNIFSLEGRNISTGDVPNPCVKNQQHQALFNSVKRFIDSLHSVYDYSSKFIKEVDDEEIFGRGIEEPQDTEETCDKSHQGKSFLSPILSSTSSSSYWRNCYNNTKFILFNSDEEEPQGVFYFLGCYDNSFLSFSVDTNNRRHYASSPATPTQSLSSSFSKLFPFPKRKTSVTPSSPILSSYQSSQGAGYGSAFSPPSSPLSSASPPCSIFHGSSSPITISGKKNILMTNSIPTFVRKKTTYNNPAIITENSLNTVRVTCSSQKVGKLATWLSRKQTACWTENNKYSYFQVDLGRFMKLVPTHYRMRYGSKSWKVLPRTWELQGSNDGKNWKIIRKHKDDDTFKKQDYTPACWIVDERESPDVFGEAFRYFRVMLTDRTASQHPDWEFVLVVTGFELFGALIISPEFDHFHHYLHQTKTLELICSIAQKDSMSKIKMLIDEHFENFFKISDVVTPFGETLLHIASQYNYADCVLYLIEEKKASLTSLTDCGQSVYDVTKNTEIRDIIHQAQITSLSNQICSIKGTMESKMKKQQEEINEMKQIIQRLVQIANHSSIEVMNKKVMVHHVSEGSHLHQLEQELEAEGDKQEPTLHLQAEQP